MMIKNNIYAFSLILFALGLYLFLMGAEYIVAKLVSGKKNNKKLTFYSPLFQNIIWTFFVGYAVFHLSKVYLFVVLGLFAVVLFLGRSFFQNFFSGILFRLQKGDLRGRLLTVEDADGTLLDYGVTSVSLRSDEGHLWHIPYEKLYQEYLVQKVKVEKTKMQVLKVFVAEDFKITSQHIASLHKKILLNPYISANEKVHITTGVENGQQWVQFSYDLVNPKYASQLKEMLQKEVQKL